mmetsp:Transcript_23816/g.34923  ORF Transcript_23816/g.34923 Transcript_23816/m.34923 type:complete len:324 (-) Transcript_23816:102-1073(-)|eukprot:CAMPEP_0185040478 /NCGR_PEP_ID=MMETSP1103-20130426/38588_1 /TAXON_ID=36769 /ORGANISM="Paraphysomonas bandaiensis, Strain Caron Lab Isolate" /LENGTH=323 /DNA_ID=CAMNT_0027579795 /DNA_START=175 /DNA_END=1146 /DNA_ORIENTATION=+
MINAILQSSLYKKHCQADKILMPLSVVLGVTVGAIVSGNNELSPNYRPVSSIMGWTYFFMWAISFWPQVITNYKNQSTLGLAPDKLIYDVVGFVCLVLYECFMYFVPVVREAYAYTHDGKIPEVEINDVWFAAHSMLLTFIVIGQMIYYDGKEQMPTTGAIILSSVLGIVIALGLVSVYMAREVDCLVCSFLNWLYLLSSIKVLITVLKFYPQVLSNLRRKSTQGWNIYGTWLDLTGSILSILQLTLDCYDQNDWKGVEGNFVKMALGVISGSYDIIFIIQHYILYPNTGDDRVVEGSAAGGVELKYTKVVQDDGDGDDAASV